MVHENILVGKHLADLIKYCLSLLRKQDRLALVWKTKVGRPVLI